MIPLIESTYKYNYKIRKPAIHFLGNDGFPMCGVNPNKMSFEVKHSTNKSDVTCLRCKRSI